MNIFQIHVPIISTPANFKKIKKALNYFKNTATNSKLNISIAKTGQEGIRNSATFKKSDVTNLI